MDRKSITLHDLRARVEAQKRQIHVKYLQYLDASDPIQRYAGLVATLLMARCDSMLLYRHLPQTSLQPRSDSENRLRDVLLTAALTTLEIGATLDTLPSLSSWAWYSTTYQQYHAVLLLLTELYRTPDLARKDRMMTAIDHIFGHCYGVGVRERCSDLLWTVKENLEAFYIMKGIPKKSAAPPQQHPTLQPLSLHHSAAANNAGAANANNTGGGNGTPDMNQMAMTGLQTPMDNLNVDFESLLGGLGGAGPGTGGSEEFNSFLAHMQSNDHGAIFVPVDNAAAVQGAGGAEWGDGVGVGVSGTTSPNGLQQWVRIALSHFVPKRY